MMLFQALKRHRLGSETVFNYAEKTIEPERLRGYQHLLMMFMDNGTPSQSPFSVQAIAKTGLELGRKPGDWYGPQAICMVL